MKRLAKNCEISNPIEVEKFVFEKDWSRNTKNLYFDAYTHYCKANELEWPQVPYGHIPWKDNEKGDSFNTFMILVFEHAGTHVDAPIHLGGVEGPAIDEIPLSGWMGEAYVLDMTHKKEKEYVTVDEVEQWES